MISKAILQSVLGVGIAGGVATGAYFLLSENKTETAKKEEIPPKSMAEFISKKGWVPLDKSPEGEDKTKWEKLVSKYESVKEPSKKITIDEFKSGDTNKEHNVKALQNACDKLLKTDKDFETNQEITKEWCTKQSTLANKD